MFEQMLTDGNHLGLYAEKTGPRGEALDNFPQAFCAWGSVRVPIIEAGLQAGQIMKRWPEAFAL